MPKVLDAAEYNKAEETAYERAYRENHEDDRRKKLIRTLNKIHKKFDEIYVEFSKLNPTQQFAVADFHTEGHTLQHCMRWGQQAAEELEAAARSNQLK